MFSCFREKEPIELDPILEEFYLTYEEDENYVDFDEEEFMLEHELTAFDVVKLMIRNGIAAMTYCYL